MTAGAVVLAYNLPDLQDDLKLTREAYCGIFLGEITKLERSEDRGDQPGTEEGRP